jgi:hypothetical protein|tara:strand:+ start:87 stop:317 length:231 start_codon:yes stop_codon:yes gene_type:complete
MPPQLTGGTMAEAKDYKERLSKIIQESIEANQAQILQGAPSMEDYKYMLGIQHTLTDLQSRLHSELVKLVRETHDG